MERGILEMLPRVGRTQVEGQLSRPPGEGSLPRHEGGEKEDGAVGRVAAPPECPRPTPPNLWLYHIQQRCFASGIKNLQKGGLSRIIQMSPQVITRVLTHDEFSQVLCIKCHCAITGRLSVLLLGRPGPALTVWNHRGHVPCFCPLSNLFVFPQRQCYQRKGSSSKEDRAT